MNKGIIVGLICAVLLIGIAAAYMINQRNKTLESSQMQDDKKIPGDSMTERAINNAASGNQPMDDESLPSDTKPKSNNLQGDGAMQGGVIMEGPADLN